MQKKFKNQPRISRKKSEDFILWFPIVNPIGGGVNFYCVYFLFNIFDTACSAEYPFTLTNTRKES